MQNIHYQISSERPQAHVFNVELSFQASTLKQQKIRLPNWIPGSYMIRDFAKNIIDINATCDGQPLALQQIDKSTWQLADKQTEHVMTVRIKYRVYAWDLSVRAAHLDQTHGFFNGTSVFLELVNYSDQPCLVEIRRPELTACATWKLATSLTVKEIDAAGFGMYQAEDYAELIDHPVEMADFHKLSFSACGVPHHIVLTGQLGDLDGTRLVQDLTLICEHHIRFFGEPAPIEQYVFLVMVVGEGYGGLEHRSSTSLLVSRKDLPKIGESMTDDYRQFLGLCSHEYFHTWNVKRMTPKVFLEADLQTEAYSPLLWAVEGITSYYDDLALYRTGLITLESYLELLAQTMTRVLKTKGRKIQSITESSFNAWTKFYKQDENASNAIVSYYAKGTLVALCLDLYLRKHSGQKLSLDHVMRALWQDYLSGERGFDDDTVQCKVTQMLGQPCDAFFDLLLHQTDELPLEGLLATVDVKVVKQAAATQSDKGGVLIEQSATSDLGAFLQQQDDFIKVVRVIEDGPAQIAGLSAGDQIVAVNRIKMSLVQLETLLQLQQPNTILNVLAFRRDELMEFDLKLQAPEKNIVVLKATQKKLQWPYALDV